MEETQSDKLKATFFALLCVHKISIQAKRNESNTKIINFRLIFLVHCGIGDECACVSIMFRNWARIVVKREIAMQ